MQQNEIYLLQEMYETYLVLLKKYAVKQGVAYDDVEDLVHEVFLEYLERYPLDLDSGAKTVLLMSILRSRWIDMIRKRNRYETISMDAPGSSDWIEPVGKGAEDRILEREVIGEIMYHQIRDIINTMKQDWRDVLILRLIANLESEEICHILKISDTVFRKRLSRARHHLQLQLRKAGITNQ